MDESTQEVWKPIPSTDGRYSASSLGRIRRNVGPYCREARILNPTRKNRSRLVVQVAKRPKRRQVRVHVLVAEAFLGPCPEGMQVNHKNRDGHDNRVENLEYVTPSQNIRHAKMTGVRNHTKLTPDDVRAIRQLRAEGISQRTVAERFGVHPNTVYQVVSRRTWWYVD